MTSPGAAGLQAERTALAWSRTSLAVLVNGALLILKDFGHYDEPLRVIGAGMAGVIAVGVYVVGLRRQRTLGRHPLPDRIAARVEVQAIGLGVPVLIIVTALALFV